MFNLVDEKEEYLTVCKSMKGLSDLTLKAYKIDLQQFCDFMNEKDCFDKNELNSYINMLHSRYKPKSAKRKIACIKAFYRYMEIEDIIDFDPFHKIILKYKEPLKLPRTIPLSCIQSILTYAYDQYAISLTKYKKETTLRNIIVIELLFSTGMRVSEVSNFKTSSINFSDNTICIFGKGSKERIMCISNNLCKTISNYLTVRSYKSDYLFVNRLGNRLSEQSIRYMVNDYANAVGAPLHVTPHMFRHTFATELHNEDVDIRYIQQFLGHSSIATTQIYTHISTSKTREILESKHPRNKMNLSLYKV
ncbi:MAG: tyrosine-type recombinase/integrase [Ruminococcus sp.]|nr:tyrosine-type recombinase/integrase [Ruminococcus sp.]